ncbi:MAG: hypothetical protein ACFFD2_08735, partial [Promethearchaeota archaeon]
MDEDQEILWEGEISQSYKTKENIAKMVLISLGSVAELITFFLYLENFNKITEAWIHTGIYFLLVLIPIGIILVIYATISTTAKNLFPKYLVTSDRLILKKWSFWRKLKIKTFNLSEINTIYIGEDIYSEKDSFWFYKKTADEILNECPDMPSPWTTEGGMEIIVGITRENKYTLIPVTLVNETLPEGEFLHMKRGEQLKVDAEDFPVFAKTGLHSEIELDQTKTITGRSISEITDSGRPEGSSGAGF